MKKATGNSGRLGIFVSTGIILFIVTLYFVGKRQQLFSSTIQVSGISAGSRSAITYAFLASMWASFAVLSK